jgi:hypothetical protein
LDVESLWNLVLVFNLLAISACEFAATLVRINQMVELDVTGAKVSQKLTLDFVLCAAINFQAGL